MYCIIWLDIPERHKVYVINCEEWIEECHNKFIGIEEDDSKILKLYELLEQHEPIEEIIEIETNTKLIVTGQII